MIDLGKDWKELPSRVEATNMRAAREMDRPPSPIPSRPGNSRARPLWNTAWTATIQRATRARPSTRICRRRFRPKNSKRRLNSHPRDVL